MAQPEDFGTDLNLLLRRYLELAEAPDLADQCGSVRLPFGLSGISTVAEELRMAGFQSRPGGRCYRGNGLLPTGIASTFGRLGSLHRR